MKQEHNKLDDFLKFKVDETDFPFEEKYWQHTLDTLNEQDKKKKRPFFWLLSILSTAIMVGIGSLIYHFSSTPSENNSAPTQKNTISQHSFISDEEKTDTNQNNMNYQKNETKNTPNIITEKIKNKNTNPNNNSTNQPQSLVNNQEKQTNKTIQKTPRITLIKTNHKQRNKNLLQDISQNQSTNKIIQQESNNLPKTYTKIKPQQIDSVQVNQSNIETIIRNPRYNEALKNYVSERIENITLITYQKNETKTETQALPNTPTEPKTIDSNEHKTKILNWFILGGASLNKGFAGNIQHSTNWGIAPFLNIGFEKNIRSKISIATQIGFTYFNAINLRKEIANYQYSFGLDSSIFAIDYKRIYQIQLPFNFIYSINKNNSIFGGLGASYMFNTMSKVNNDGNISNQNGYKQGMNPFDVFAQIGYQFQINNRFALLATYQGGFINAYQKSYFNTQQNSTQNKIIVGLKYSISKNEK